MFRRELVEAYGPYRGGDFPEDYELWLRLMDAGVVMAKVPEILLTWNDPPKRLSRQDPRYRPEAFARIKAGYLARELERRSIREILIWGAGRTSRKRAAFLEEHNIAIRAYIDIDPCKIGQRVHGRPVICRTELPQSGQVFIVSYVGSRGAGQEIEAFLQGRGYQPGRDYLLAG
jgi:cellulose synthase/poly-beta-1,6-N-acetylglucosamine synthase-like glycosyltransferase